MTFHIWSTLDNHLHDYADVWLLLTSPAGREYIRNNLDAVLDYIAYLINSRLCPNCGVTIIPHQTSDEGILACPECNHHWLKQLEK